MLGLTQVLSEMDNIRGAYGDMRLVDLCAGEPNPAMPDTLYLLLDDVAVGRLS